MGHEHGVVQPRVELELAIVHQPCRNCPSSGVPPHAGAHVAVERQHEDAVIVAETVEEVVDGPAGFARRPVVADAGREVEDHGHIEREAHRIEHHLDGLLLAVLPDPEVLHAQSANRLALAVDNRGLHAGHAHAGRETRSGVLLFLRGRRGLLLRRRTPGPERRERGRPCRPATARLSDARQGPFPEGEGWDPSGDVRDRDARASRFELPAIWQNAAAPGDTPCRFPNIYNPRYRDLLHVVSTMNAGLSGQRPRRHDPVGQPHPVALDRLHVRRTSRQRLGEPGRGRARVGASRGDRGDREGRPPSAPGCAAPQGRHHLSGHRAAAALPRRERQERWHVLDHCRHGGRCRRPKRIVTGNGESALVSALEEIAARFRSMSSPPSIPEMTIPVPTDDPALADVSPREMDVLEFAGRGRPRSGHRRANSSSASTPCGITSSRCSARRGRRRRPRLIKFVRAL